MRIKTGEYETLKWDISQSSAMHNQDLACKQAIQMPFPVYSRMVWNAVTIRPVKEKDLKFVSDKSIAEHWNYPVYYLETLRQISPGGFLVAENREGQIVGCGIVTNLSDTISFFGLDLTGENTENKEFTKIC
ncbi:uncharacterized protein LOC144360109 [Saccoglossus kowalevskii]